MPRVLLSALCKVGGEVRGGSERKIRGDLMCWVEYKQCTPAMRALMQAADALVLALPPLLPELTAGERMLMRASGMVTAYPGDGAAYVRHVDNNAGNGRVLTTILYLNAAWQEQHGGALRLYVKGGGPVDVHPVFNRFIVFWSDHRCPHEVPVSCLCCMRSLCCVWGPLRSLLCLCAALCAVRRCRCCQPSKCLGTR